MSHKLKGPLTLLIDANNLICQMYYGNGGESGNAQKAVRRKIQQLIERYQPVYVLAGIDDDENFRTQLDEAYKKGRREKPEALQNMIFSAADLMHEAGATPVQANGFEADDVLATLARRAPGEVVIVSSDRDLYSLLSDEVSIFDLNEKRLIEQTGAETHYGVPGPLVPFYKALMGDGSDRMLGAARRLGPVTAAQLVVTYRTPAALFAALPDLSQRIQKALARSNQKTVENYVVLHTLNDQAPTRLVQTKKGADELV